jgi:hypothetical protein
MICQTGRVLVDATDGTQTRQIELCSGQAVLIEHGIFTSETYVDHDTGCHSNDRSVARFAA